MGLGSALLVSLFVWAVATEVDIVVSAPAEARPKDGVFELRAAASGIVGRLSVRDGDLVESGSVLIVLSDVTSEREVRAKAAALEDRRRRLREDLALQQAVEGRRQAPASATANARLARHRDTMARLRREGDALAAELELARARLGAARRERAIADSRHQAVDQAHRRGAVSRFDWLRSRSALGQRDADIVAAQGSIRVLESRLAAHGHAVGERAGAFELDLIDSIASARVDVARLEAELAEARRVQRSGRVLAPFAGTVEQLNVGVGDYVERGEVLGLVVPASSDLVFEARIPPAQVAFLSPGQPCRLKLDALPFVRYGALSCVLVRIGRDSVSDGAGPVHYRARVRVATTRVLADGEAFDLSPGATAWVDIVAGRRTVLGYFTEPLQRFAREALRER